MPKEKYKITVEISAFVELIINDIELVDFLAIIPVLSRMKLISYGNEQSAKLIMEKDEPNAEVNE